MESPRSVRERPPTPALAIGALGIVYGDLLTSPLYSLREAFDNADHPLAVDRLNVLGAMSVVVWTLVILVALKYVTFVMRADNDGEGGILALTALVTGGPEDPDVRRRAGRPLVVLGLFGAALLYGDGLITPSISVLSAIEGLEVVHPSLDAAVVPCAVAVLVGLFSIQRFGTLRVGKIFGPVLLIWLLSMAAVATLSLARTPETLQAINPVHAYRYFAENTYRGLLSMGSLFLVVTGAEALYADMGHLGRRPITSLWWRLVMPALLVTYLGIGANLLRSPNTIRSPFFLMAPSALRLPFVVLATLATIIASQSLISGVFSITHQASKFGYAPRTRVVYTSPATRGQVYLPGVNWTLMLLCVAMVLIFRSSVNLAAAMGLSVTGTMLITTLLFAQHARRSWNWTLPVLVPLVGVFIAIEGAFFVANVFKIPHGGWVTIAVAGVVFTLMTTWKTGRSLLNARLRSSHLTVAQLANKVESGELAVRRVPGTGVYFFSEAGVVPPSMLIQMRGFATFQERVLIVTLVTEDRPHVLPIKRVELRSHPAGISDVVLHYGFMEDTPVAHDLEQFLDVRRESAYYFVARETVRPTGQLHMTRWRQVLFALMNRNASDVTESFGLPPDRVVEIGTPVEI